MKQTLISSNIHFDKAIIIDFPGFNFKVATLLKKDEHSHTNLYNP